MSRVSIMERMRLLVAGIFLSLLTIANARSSLRVRDVVVPTNLPADWEYKGCFTEGTGGRALTGATFNDAALTAESCIAFCDSKNAIYAGTEYSAECYCGTPLSGGSVLTAAGDCSMPCSGNASQACGGPNRLTLFQNTIRQAPADPVVNPGPAGWISLGCYSDGGARTLTYPAGTTGGAGVLTVALCTSACQSAKYSLAGVEYGGECYCGNAFSGNGAPVTSGCSMTCNGNSSEYCGGPNRLNIYQLDGSVIPSATSSVRTATATATAVPTGWSYRGCYVDNKFGRILNTQIPDEADMTVESCIVSCGSQGLSVAGLEYSTQCFCGKYIIQGGKPATDETECSMNCGGNANEKCGGPSRMSIYATGTLQAFDPPVPQKVDLPGSWEYQGCLTDNVGNKGRTFPYQLIMPTNNSAENCLKHCSDFGFGAGGMEYGEECYCGDVANIAASGAILNPETECSTACPGNVSYICGAGNRISYYKWNGTPLSDWKFATGNDAGEYRFLIGGVVIPLVITEGINGKVTFVEKHGTGPPNSTGAYELDLSLVDDFSKAWRTMNVKTDVFCSAGLVLPDKVGRQINIGGWSLESTFGVRLYWPDGSPGKLSTNDWQENVQELSLQQGRWYPSAMVMANGSILVVGGEQGSNGRAIPTLEILPKPIGGNVVFADYLNRTDPYNLYPFLTVLPSGGIFIAYYNEARILDERSFETVKTLPNIPVAVNNPKGGRTYPYEGTQVLLPQHPPYADPLTVFICGGSTPGGGFALDNCVSIQPEASAPQWVLERMPSRRVMPCISALPDGTYLILNGAHQGEAGFGLATDPNHNAILYDPSKPRNARFTVMANTTIDRLYHSESMLLADGRVLVTGSDPQDNVHPQEYRVEVFMPPYLLSGAPRPAYNIQNKDWTYGATVQITVTLPSGNTANMRVSLLGAESSTHGNSMGQRTIFLAFTCAGTTCTITAPPNAHVSPPGWFKLFVLDGPTPSIGQWLRIGGDPAELGNWPNFPDFKVPGI